MEIQRRKLSCTCQKSAARNSLDPVEEGPIFIVVVVVVVVVVSVRIGAVSACKTLLAVQDIGALIFSLKLPRGLGHWRTSQLQFGFILPETDNRSKYFIS